MSLTMMSKNIVQLYTETDICTDLAVTYKLNTCLLIACMNNNNNKAITMRHLRQLKQADHR